MRRWGQAGGGAGQLEAGHLRHREVGDEQVEVTGRLAECHQGIGGPRDPHDAVAQAYQHLLDL